MSLENPYRAAGAFSGKAYIRRDADAQLIEQIEDNQYYPYFAAPRQSGKSSLLLRTMAALDPKRYRCALVDLSPFVVTSYDDFWRQFLHEVARSANFDPAPIGQEDPRDVLLLWLRSCRQRLIVFLDEIDVLLNVDFREQIFSKFRTFFNLRARLDTADLQRLQFVLAGAAHSSRFIKDPRWSPFNVAIEIELEDLSAAQVSQLAAYLGTAGSFAGPDLTARVYELSGGSVFLCQLIFEQLWNQAARGKSRLGAADVDAVVNSIVAESPRNIHFYNIFRLVTADARLTMLFRRLTEGQELGHEEAKELRLTGICRGANPFRNEVYARVFGPGGPLDLKVGDKQIQLTRALDGAIGRRDRLQNDPRADPRSIAAAEAEIKRLRKEFREGAQLQAGDVLGRGRYRLEERIGQGGFAAVWRAIDTRDQTPVAIKVLHGQHAEDKSRRERFFRGAWKMSELQHPAIVRVVEPYGDENGQFYFVMEHLPGGTLHAAVQEMELSADRALKMLMQVGEALHFAHERGLVHRDVKPSNVLIDGDRGKLTDFDLVRETDITGGTRTGAMGTFLYAAPEVMSRPQDADPRADIYGLGMTAVFALFGGDLAMDVIRDADRFIDRLPCNPVIHDVLKKAVAWDRNDRFATAAEFVAALGQACEAEAGPVRSKRAAAAERAAIAVGATMPAPAAKPAPMRAPTGVPPASAASESSRGLPRPAQASAGGGESSAGLVRPATWLAGESGSSLERSTGRAGESSAGLRSATAHADESSAGLRPATGRADESSAGLRPTTGRADESSAGLRLATARAAGPPAVEANRGLTRAGLPVPDGRVVAAEPSRGPASPPPPVVAASAAPAAAGSRPVASSTTAGPRPPGEVVERSPARSAGRGEASPGAAAPGSPAAQSPRPPQAAARPEKSASGSEPVARNRARESSRARSADRTSVIAVVPEIAEVSAGSLINMSVIRSTASYGAVSAPIADDDDLDDAPWDREVMVPERTDTRMLRAAVQRSAAAATIRDGSPPRAAPAALPREHVAQDMSQETDSRAGPPRSRATGDTLASASPAEPFPVQSARSGWVLPAALVAVAAALVLAFVLPDLLTPRDSEGRRLTADAGDPSKREAIETQIVIPELRQLPSAPPDATVEPPGATDQPASATVGSLAPERPTAEPPVDDTTGTPAEAGSEAHAETGTVVDPAVTAASSPSGPAASGEAETTPTPTAGDSKHHDTGERPPPQVKPVSTQIKEGCDEVRLGDAGRGVALLRKAHDRKPRDMRLQLCLADGYAKLNEWEAAASYYERLVDAYPRHSQALLGAAQANEALNRRTAARAFYGQVLALDPENRSARAFFADDKRSKVPDRPAP